MKQLFFGNSMQGNKAFNITWALFRVYVGLSIAIGAGFPKMKDIAAPGWFVDQVRDIGFTFPSPAFWAAAASWGEFVGGLCIAVGFFTRFSALQLAFQFFVVSFIWYDNPMPMLGMYYQQLLFWCFLIITVAGSGRYAVDEWIIQRKKANFPTYIAPVAMMMMMFITTSSFNTKIKEPIVTTADLAALNGKWKGTLTYKDYTSGEDVSILVNIDISMKDD
ncbi:MAG: DoxX family protein, partial [Chitinophagaceae bacterium]|nr:DoxX family protein [Chitinophagaceae bacterium]